MAPSITFRLKSSNHVGTIDMEGNVMSCRDAQQAIAAKLSAPPEEINVFMAGSTSLLHPDEDLPAYSVVDVVRQTYTGKPIFSSRPRSTMPFASSGGAEGTAPGGPASHSNLPLTEEERIAQLQAEVSLDTGIDEVSTRYRRGGRGGFVGGRGGGGRGEGMRPNMDEMFRPPPKGYICHNCGKGGHLIQHCPSAKGGKAVKVLSQPLGIPESMLVECTMDDPAPKFITRDHRLVKRRVDPSAFSSISIAGLAPTSSLPVPENTSAGGTDGIDVSEDRVEATEERDAPVKLLCIADKVLARDAMRLPCCGRLMCHDCFNTMAEAALDGDCPAYSDDDGDSEEGCVRCPNCKEPLIMDDVVPAVAEREEIQILSASRKRMRPF